MRILIDTNVFIPLEDSGTTLADKLAYLSRLASGAHQLLIHPASNEDIKRDKHASRRESMLLRLQKYHELESPPHLESFEEISLFGMPAKDNHHVDNLILYSLYKNCVHWLVTEDRGIHQKAKKLGVSERVHTIDQAIVALSSLAKVDLDVHPHVEDVPCHNLDLKNPLFDSLRSAYPGFDDWFAKQSQEGRHAWVCRSEEEIHSICIYKIENDEIVTNDNRALPGKLLKLCTFKVVKFGYKLGELMLKQAFNYAGRNGINNIYLTVEPGAHKELDRLLSDFGFQFYGIDKKGRDEVMEKPYNKMPIDESLSDLDYCIRYYPSIKLSENKAYIVPIQPKYHKTLFPENQPQIDLFADSNNSAGNSIKQAYLCKSPNKSIRPGDIVFFYRTHDEKCITTYGVVDVFAIEREAEEIYQWVSKRTVYSYDEIKGMSGCDVRIILFRQVGHLESPVSYKVLRGLDVVKGPIQSVTSLSRDNAKKLIEVANINDCFIPD